VLRGSIGSEEFWVNDGQEDDQVHCSERTGDFHYIVSDPGDDIFPGC
jgi:hypothetical protein